MFLTDLKFSKIVAKAFRTIVLHIKEHDKQMSNIVCQQYQNIIIRDISFEKMKSRKNSNNCNQNI